jgi:hypothetical protein
VGEKGFKPIQGLLSGGAATFVESSRNLDDCVIHQNDLLQCEKVFHHMVNMGHPVSLITAANLFKAETPRSGFSPHKPL